MHYDDGLDTQPGEDLSLGNHEIGRANYDMDGDGVADSYIMVTGSDEVTVLTDSNDDGQVDTLYQIDHDGSVTEMQAPNGHMVEVGTGHLDGNDRIVMDGSGTGGHGGDGTTGGDATTGGDGSTGVNAGHGGGDITMTDDGKTLDVGSPTIDLTGDGVNDTVALQGPDGSTVLVADTDHDGNADNIAQINSDGSVTFAVPDGHGGWVVAGVGHVDAQGTISQELGGPVGEPYQPPVDLSGQAPAGGDAGGTDPGHPDSGADPGHGGGEDITVDVGGKSYDVGPATMDADGNGTPDTAVVKTDDGTTLLVTDVDGNGTADQILQVDPDGSATIQQTDGNGDWATVATGHVDADGNLVLDKQ